MDERKGEKALCFPRVFLFPSAPTTQRGEASASAEEKVLFPKPSVQRSCEFFSALSISQLVSHIINSYEFLSICPMVFSSPPNGNLLFGYGILT